MVFTGAQPALACSYTEAPEVFGQTSGQYFAKLMTGAASYVDLVLVDDDGTRPLGEPDTNIITVRTIARLKGNSADRFSLFGRAALVCTTAAMEFRPC